MLKYIVTFVGVAPFTLTIPTIFKDGKIDWKTSFSHVKRLAGEGAVVEYAS